MCSSPFDRKGSADDAFDEATVSVGQVERKLENLLFREGIFGAPPTKMATSNSDPIEHYRERLLSTIDVERSATRTFWILITTTTKQSASLVQYLRFLLSSAYRGQFR